MTSMKRPGLTAALLAVLVLSFPTPAMAAESSQDAVRLQASGICDLFPELWWCKK